MAPSCLKHLLAITANCRPTSFTSLNNGRSAGIALDKPGAGAPGKQGCKGNRVIHVLCPFWKAWHAAGLAQGARPELPPSDRGFAVGRRREKHLGPSGSGLPPAEG